MTLICQIIIIKLPYTMKLSRQKTFAVFAVFGTTTKVFHAKISCVINNKIALFKYGFKRLREDLVLPDPHWELSKVLFTSTIEEANKEVKDVLVREKGSRRLPYLKATPEKKAIIGKYAAEHGVVNAIRRYEKDFVSSFSTNSLKESSVLITIEK